MSVPDPLADFDKLGYHEKMIVAMLAMAGEPMGRARLHEHLSAANVRNDDDLLAHDLAKLHAQDLVGQITGRGWTVPAQLCWPALKAALDAGAFAHLAHAYQNLTPLRRNWEGFAILRSYRQGIALLRIALISGASPSEIGPLLAACMSCHEAGYLHPLVDICARPFEAELFARIHPQMRDEVLTVLIENAQREPASAPLLRAYAEKHLAGAASSMALRTVMTEHYILCGRLDVALSLTQHLDQSLALFYSSVILLLRDDLEAATGGFEAALKALRRETGKRKMGFPGLGGHLYVLALLRSKDTKHHKAADTYLDSAARVVQNHDTAVYQQLSMLRQIRGGTVDATVLPTRNWESALQPFMFRALMHYWLAQPQLTAKRDALEQMLALSELAGFDLLSAQLAALLGRLGSVTHEQRAIALRQQRRLADMTGWFEREEPWQRQLNALINLQPAVNVEAVKETRLVWGIRFDPTYGVQDLEPREQKRDAQGGWSRGRAVGLKRLSEDAGSLEFLTAQDLNVIATMKAFKYYSSSGARYEFDLEKAVAALIGHPLLFWIDAPGTRVELLPGEPELSIKADSVNVTITMRPQVLDDTDDVCVTRETPTRLRVVKISEEHRRIGAIIGAGLVVPLHAEKQVLKAISAISSIVTVQSDIGASAADIAQVAADDRLHVHLLPYQQGLKKQVLVRPLPGAGA